MLAALSSACCACLQYYLLPSVLLAVLAARLNAAVLDLVDGGAGGLEVHQGLAVSGVVNLGSRGQLGLDGMGKTFMFH